MKTPVIPLLTLLLFSISCSRGSAPTGASAPPASDAYMSDKSAPATAQREQLTEKETANVSRDSAPNEKVSLLSADKAELTNAAADRKIIRNADVTLEVDSTTDAQHRVTSIAEANGGFVVTSEAKQREHVDPSKRTIDIKLVVRIPSEKFGTALDQIKQLAGNLPAENVTGQDVTEDFIDLEARIKTQRALELQFLAIMKQADSVVEALEVQRQIADVRTDIEKLEGRKRFLENRSSLSTITVNIQTPKMITVSPTGFGRSVRDAVSDSLELASGLFVFFPRTVIVMLPIVVFVILPAGLIIRYAIRRAARTQPMVTPAD
jgi:Domain of unknown function (DUF4349)